MTPLSASEETANASSKVIDGNPPSGPRKRSFLAGLARVLLLLCIACLAFGGGFAVQGYLMLSKRLPSVDKLKHYEPALVTQVFDDNGDLIAEFCHERRYLVSLDEIPLALRDAILAAEGEDFLKKSILRSLSVMGPRRPTVQLIEDAKAALGFYRLEQAMTKEEVLCRFMNQIYLGSGAYGVEAAARTYFGKSARDLTLAECAMIAALARSPRQFSPRRKMKSALKARNCVLARMWKDGKITRAEYDKASAEEIVLVDEANNNKREAGASIEPVRRYIEKKYGAETLFNDGLKVYTTVDLAHSEAAQEEISRPKASIKRIVDRHGKVLEDHSPPLVPDLPPRFEESRVR
ncbi:MAG: transglycosylase domain-containing protein [Desulfomonile tiedjei]|nr:transglycosylase domain-containing protein [Desulfomonile tiedjei]